MKRRKCTKCHKNRYLSKYRRNVKGKDGLTYWCIYCFREHDKQRAMLPHRVKQRKDYAGTTKGQVVKLAASLKHNYGITLEDYNKLYKKQKYSCAICKLGVYGQRPKRLSVDHCHKTKTVRGLLCLRCNSGLGYFNDSIENLTVAIKYLKRFL